MQKKHILDAYRFKDLDYLRLNLDLAGIYSGVPTAVFFESMAILFENMEANEYDVYPFTCKELSSNQEGYALIDQAFYCDLLLILTVVEDVVIDIQSYTGNQESGLKFEFDNNWEINYAEISIFKIYEDDKIGFDPTLLSYEIFVRERGISQLRDQSNISPLDTGFLTTWFERYRQFSSNGLNESDKVYRFKENFTKYLDAVQEYLFWEKLHKDYEIFLKFYNVLDPTDKHEMSLWQRIVEREFKDSVEIECFASPWIIADEELSFLDLKFDFTGFQDVVVFNKKYQALTKYHQISFAQRNTN